MPPLTKKKILVIDDDSAIRQWVIAALTQAGYDCQEAEDGEIGVALAGIFMPDVILCDVEMPRVNGHEVFRRLSQNSRTSFIPFIFVTGRDLREDVRKGMALGADDYLTKPMTIAELLDSIRTRLNKKQLMDRQGQTKIQHAKDSVARQISYDTLTQLPNRYLLLKQFREMDQTNFIAGPLAILSIGIDNLRHITEAFGAPCEELVLRIVVRRLKRYLDSDAVVYRGKHDSFDVLVRNSKDKNKLESLMKEVVRGLSESISFKKQVFRIQVSIGCTSYDPQKKESVETILNRTETARHFVRKEAEKGYCFYLPEMQKSVVDRLTLENLLYKAVKNKDFALFYQPQLEIGTRHIKAVEALIRWNSSKFGMVAPLQFIPLAEENGLILPIGKWVLDESCRQLKKWQQKGLDLRMAVNISGRQLETGDLVFHVEEALKESGILPGSLELEITESLLIKDFNKTLEQIKSLREQGVMIAIDDFGTGYSALSSLKKFPFDTLKIDRSFITDIEAHVSNLEIVSAIIKMAQNLNLKTVAEGVETLGQLECLKKIHCDQFQGFLFSRAVPAQDILPLVENSQD